MADLSIDLRTNGPFYLVHMELLRLIFEHDLIPENSFASHYNTGVDGNAPEIVLRKATTPPFNDAGELYGATLATLVEKDDGHVTLTLHDTEEKEDSYNAVASGLSALFPL